MGGTTSTESTPKRLSTDTADQADCAVAKPESALPPLYRQAPTTPPRPQQLLKSSICTENSYKPVKEGLTVAGEVYGPEDTIESALKTLGLEEHLLVSRMTYAIELESVVDKTTHRGKAHRVYDDSGTLGRIGLHHDLWYEEKNGEVILGKETPMTVFAASGRSCRHERYKKTIFLDLDGTLLHSTDIWCREDNTRNGRPVQADLFSESFFGSIGGTTCNWKVYSYERPGVHEFLESIPEDWEVIIFTAGTPFYAELLVPALFKAHFHWQKQKGIKREYHFKILARDHTWSVFKDKNGKRFRNSNGRVLPYRLVKQLENANVEDTRHLSTCMLVDNAAYAVYAPYDSPENERNCHIPVPDYTGAPYYGEDDDRYLSHVTDFLKTLEKVDDVRPRIRDTFHSEQLHALVRRDVENSRK